MSSDVTQTSVSVLLDVTLTTQDIPGVNVKIDLLT